MTFETEAEVGITIPQRQLRDARSDIEESLGSVEVSVDADGARGGGGGGGGSGGKVSTGTMVEIQRRTLVAQRDSADFDEERNKILENMARGLDDGGGRGLAGLAGGAKVIDELGDQTDYLEDILEELEKIGASGGGGGGGGLGSTGLGFGIGSMVGGGGGLLATVLNKVRGGATKVGPRGIGGLTGLPHFLNAGRSMMEGDEGAAGWDVGKGLFSTGGAATGAAAGSMFGPLGTIGGGIAGGLGAESLFEPLFGSPASTEELNQNVRENEQADMLVDAQRPDWLDSLMNPPWAETQPSWIDTLSSTPSWMEQAPSWFQQTFGGDGQGAQQNRQLVGGATNAAFSMAGAGPVGGAFNLGMQGLMQGNEGYTMTTAGINTGGGTYGDQPQRENRARRQRAGNAQFDIGPFEMNLNDGQIERAVNRAFQNNLPEIIRQLERSISQGVRR